MATARALQNARRQKIYRERKKHNRKVVPVEIPADMPVRLTEAEMAELFRKFSLEERFQLGGKLERVVKLALIQISTWYEHAAPFAKPGDEIKYISYRLSGPALVKAKEIVKSGNMFSIAFWGEEPTNITDANYIHALPDYVSMVREWFDIDVLSLFKEHLKAKGFRWNPYGLPDSELDRFENIFSKDRRTVN